MNHPYYNATTATVGYWADNQFYTTSDEYWGSYEDGHYRLYDAEDITLRSGKAANLEDAQRLLSEGLREFELNGDLPDEGLTFVLQPGVYQVFTLNGQGSYDMHVYTDSLSLGDLLFTINYNGIEDPHAFRDSEAQEQLLLQINLSAAIAPSWSRECKGLYVATHKGYVLCVEKDANGTYTASARRYIEEIEESLIFFEMTFFLKEDAMCALSTLVYTDVGANETDLCAG